jgi:hypothetical protein
MFAISILTVLLLQFAGINPAGPPRASDWPDAPRRATIVLSEDDARRLYQSLIERRAYDADPDELLLAIGRGLPEIDPAIPLYRPRGEWELADRKTKTIWSGPDPHLVRSWVEFVEGGLADVPEGPPRRPVPKSHAMTDWKRWRGWRASRR